MDQEDNSPIKPAPVNLTSIRDARRKNPAPGLSVNFESDNPQSIQSGMLVEHVRFGRGKVLQVEGDGTNRKAVVFFKTSGQKQLLLKFARLKILKH